MMPSDCAGALGCQEPLDDGTSNLYVLEDYKGNQYAAAAILGHEILHAIWWKDFFDYYTGKQPAPIVGMPIPGGGVRNSYSEDQEYNTKKVGGEIWKDLKTKHPSSVYDDSNLWWQPEGDERHFVGVPEDEAKASLASVYKYTFENKY